VTRSARTTRATRLGRSLALPPLSVVLLATIAPALRDTCRQQLARAKRIRGTSPRPHARAPQRGHDSLAGAPPRPHYGVGATEAAGVAEPDDTESGMGGTNAVSIILEYSIETLPARSILVALAGSAYV
jgi:hypothetical protein